MATAPPDRECDRFDAEMEVIDSWSTKSPPLIGTRIEHAEYECPECGSRALFKRKEDERAWQAA